MPCARLILLLLLPLLAAACAGPDRPLYPPPRELAEAPLLRRDFVDAFLQGRTCQARGLFAASLAANLRRDDVCAAAYDQALVHALKAYLGGSDPQALERAAHYRRLGGGCPGWDLPAAGGAALDAPEADRRYRGLIEANDFKALSKALAREADPLYASVYARRGARRAADAGRPAEARALVEAARQGDARQGWVLFLAEDWRLAAELATSDTERENALARRAELTALIEPCATDTWPTR